MKKERHYIFLTYEGYTYSPKADTIEPDVDNLQVIGFAKGKNKNEAFKNLIKQHPYLIKSGFNEIFCLELKEDPNKAKFFYINPKCSSQNS